MSKPAISQTEARRLRKRVDYLEGVLRHQARRYGSEWPGGQVIASRTYPSDESLVVTVRTARTLGHGVAVIEHQGALTYRALPHPEVKP